MFIYSDLLHWIHDRSLVLFFNWGLNPELYHQATHRAPRQHAFFYVETRYHYGGHELTE